jgi:hypothetical protein
MKHSPHLNVALQRERCFMIHKNNKNKISLGVKEQAPYELDDDKEAKSHVFLARSGRNNNLLSHTRYGH